MNDSLWCQRWPYVVSVTLKRESYNLLRKAVVGPLHYHIFILIFLDKEKLNFVSIFLPRFQCKIFHFVSIHTHIGWSSVSSGCPCRQSSVPGRHHGNVGEEWTNGYPGYSSAAVLGECTHGNYWLSNQREMRN